MKDNNIKQYKKEFDYSYTSGAYATIEMIKANPEIVEAVYARTNYSGLTDLENLCCNYGIQIIISDKIFTKTDQKENSCVLGVFKKFIHELSGNAPHVVLVNPSDMGNMGTIIRTMAGFNMCDLAVITPAADIFNPKTVRASMGSLFHIRFREYQSFEEYRNEFLNHTCFPFMLDGKLDIREIPLNQKLFSLIFGSEAAGLPACFANYGTSVKIPLTDKVDSFNLAVAAGIGIFEFAGKNGII